MTEAAPLYTQRIALTDGSERDLPVYEPKSLDAITRPRPDDYLVAQRPRQDARTPESEPMRITVGSIIGAGHIRRERTLLASATVATARTITGGKTAENAAGVARLFSGEYDLLEAELTGTAEAESGAGTNYRLPLGAPIGTPFLRPWSFPVSDPEATPPVLGYLQLRVPSGLLTSGAWTLTLHETHPTLGTGGLAASAVTWLSASTNPALRLYGVKWALDAPAEADEPAE